MTRKSMIDTMKALKTYQFESLGFEVEDGDDLFTIKVERVNEDGSALIVNVPERSLTITKNGYVLNLNELYSVYLKSWQVNQTDKGYELLLVYDLFKPLPLNSGFKSRFGTWHDTTDWMTWMDIAYVQSERFAKWDVML